MNSLSDEHVAMSYLIEDHLQHLRAAGMSNVTVGARHDVLWRLHTHLPMGIAYAAKEQIESWLASPGWSRWTRRTYSNHVAQFYRWATANELLDGDPAATIKRPKAPRCTPRPILDDELARALGCPEPLRTAVMLGALAGLRRSEIARARREHITEQSVYIPVAKGGDSASVPTHRDLWLHVRDRPKGPLIRGPGGREVDPHWLSSTARRGFDELGMPDVTLHRLRHWFGTMIQREFGDLRVTQECLRHANVSSTQIYTAVADEQRIRAVGALALPGLG